MLRAMTIDAPLALHSEPVRPEWIDYNGHMNVAYYTMVFDHMLDAFIDFVGVGEDYTKSTKRSIFILDSRTLYLREVKANDTLRCTVQLLDFDAKRLHYCSQMEHSREGWAVALFRGCLGACRSRRPTLVADARSGSEASGRNQEGPRGSGQARSAATRRGTGPRSSRMSARRPPRAIGRRALRFAPCFALGTSIPCI